MRTATSFLIVRGDGSMRLGRQRPRLRPDEVAFRIEVAFPDGWARVSERVIALTMPEPPQLADAEEVEE
jgi:hypothetical protein